MRSQQFAYTLSPLPWVIIASMIFICYPWGFCEHYASSFTYLMRAAGVPARVVAGYQGGQLGRDGKSGKMRQMDAHAWSEIWVQGRGWVRVDPTGFVAPNRVEQGMDTVTKTLGQNVWWGVAGQISYQQFSNAAASHLSTKLATIGNAMWSVMTKTASGHRCSNGSISNLSISKWWWCLSPLCVLALGLAVVASPPWCGIGMIGLWYSYPIAWQKTNACRQDSEGCLALLDLNQKSPIKAAIQALAALYRQIRYQQPTDNKQSMRQLDNLAKTIALKTLIFNICLWYSIE